MLKKNRLIVFAISILVHLVVFMALSSAKPKECQKQLSVRQPLSVAMLFTPQRTVRTRKVTPKRVAAIEAKRAESMPLRSPARREVKKHSKTAEARLVFQTHARKNLKKKLGMHLRNNKALKKKVVTPQRVMTAIKPGSSEIIKKHFVKSPTVRMRTIIAKLPKKLFIKHINKKPDKTPGAGGSGGMETLPAKTVGLQKPEYPRYSRVHGEEGNVLVLVRVSADGKAEKVEVIHSSGYGRLDRAAIIALNDVNFIPARLDGRTISSIKKIAFSFKLE